MNGMFMAKSSELIYKCGRPLLTTSSFHIPKIVIKNDRQRCCQTAGCQCIKYHVNMIKGGYN